MKGGAMMLSAIGFGVGATGQNEEDIREEVTESVPPDPDCGQCWARLCKY